jgi:UDP-hydrolysing UDP-N-acetyl-D-glucosamine 2-epimerase
MTPRIIGVFTGNRAEYGLQLPILRAINAHPGLDYRLVVSGAHLDPDFGRTRAEIEADGMNIHAEVEIVMDESVAYATSQAIGTGVVSIAKTLDRLHPDLFVVYADRFEGFAAVIAATQMNIPTAHVEGGDITEGGALDDSVRHAMTKLAHLHFTTNEQATRRIIAMGEEPWRVHTVGFPAIDLIADGELTDPEELSARYGLDLSRPIVLFTQHSVTTEFDLAGVQIAPAIDALRRLGKEGIQVIATYPNNDAGGRRIVDALARFAGENPPGVQIHPSLGRANYHGILSLTRHGVRVVCAGNSSSGIKETPAFGCPAVNIGSRQDNRLRADNVIDVDYDAEAIHAAIRRGIEDVQLRERSRSCDNPYGIGDAGKKIAAVLAEVPIDQRLIRKRMTIS